jgi:hypothetical protein
MRNLLLSAALIAAPVGVFAAAYTVLLPATAPTPTVAVTASPSLGDMSAFATIIGDVQKIAETGDFTAAEKRITDFETAWDAGQKTLRPVNPTDWSNVDMAADAALDALRAGKPDAATVTATLADLQSELSDPSKAPGAAPQAAVSVSGIVTTDANGRALPCEVMLDTLRTTLASATLSDADRATVVDFQAKGTERCNADDDTRADAFFAQGIALMPH